MISKKQPIRITQKRVKLSTSIATKLEKEVNLKQVMLMNTA